MRKENFMDRMALGADLPSEVFPGQPLVEIIGDRRVLVENHYAIIAYGCNEICVKMKFGVLSICGTGLKLARMSKQQLVIVGCIDSISLKRR